ncbi:MAG: glutaredoxin 3 [Gammaproteobacteria bacterium]|nr:glutaredoxin 3 [Gammaproteobacteria bacterium]MCP5196710.1 glutaredoxin 3 [Gammaproteobacteria bacterium]
MTTPSIVVYASDYCPYCRRARALLDSKGARYTLMDVDSEPCLWDEILERTGRDTVPQIFVGDQHIGGCDDLLALERSGALESLLKVGT